MRTPSPELKRPYEAILFDFDGVLADSEKIHWECWAEILREFGVDLDWETYVRHGIGLTDRELLEHLAARTEPRFNVDALYAQYPLKRQRFREKTLARPPITPPVVELLKSLGDFKLGLVTSTDRADIEPMLKRAGVFDCFGAAVYGDDDVPHKPAPDPYLAAARRLGVTTALVVEDSAAGVVSGRAAGFDVLQVPEAGRMREVLVEKLASAGYTLRPITDIM